jgi:hypothetical protein
MSLEECILAAGISWLLYLTLRENNAIVKDQKQVLEDILEAIKEK